MKIKTMDIGRQFNMDIKECFAPGFGIVKTESRSGNTQLTSIKITHKRIEVFFAGTVIKVY